MNKAIKVRAYDPDDARILADIFYDTIHIVNTRDYTLEQINAWAPDKNYNFWQDKLAITKPFIATIDNVIVGFADFETSGHIDCFYCHHDWQRKGIGKTLIAAIEKNANTKKINHTYAEVSISAKPFFNKMGFTSIKEQEVMVKGISLKNFLMEKYL